MRLRDSQDAYGHVLLDHLEGRPSFEIVEREDGHLAPSQGPALYFAPFAKWPAPERAAARFVQGRVLDVGCGAGRWALHLQRSGHEVVAIDISPLAVRVSRRRGVRDARAVSVTEIDCRLGRFDTIAMMGNNFGLLGNPRRARWLLRRFAAITSERARIVASSRDPYVGAAQHRAYHALNRGRGRLPGQLRIRVRYQRYATPWFEYLLASRPEMQALLAGSGWSVRRFFGSSGPLYAALIEKRVE